MREYLPSKLDYSDVCDLLDDRKKTWWLPAIQFVCQKHSLKISSIRRIEEGGNLLIQVNDKLIVKFVPPHWKYQGQAEIEAFRVLNGKLPFPIPEVTHHGELDGWIYVIQHMLPGKSLSEFWAKMSFSNKQHIVKQVADIMNALHSISPPKETMLRKDWKSYYQQLSDDCVPRHFRKGVSELLISQISNFMESTSSNSYQVLDDLASSEQDLFIHMDLHPWNLMVEEKEEQFSICGVLDFGDSIIGRSRLLEIATPILFLCQGDAELCNVLLENYQYTSEIAGPSLQHKLMAVSLLRPACDFNFVLSQVPESGPRENWYQIAEQLFPV